MPALVFLSWLIGVCLAVEVNQTPPALIRRPGEKVQLVCTHGKTDYYLMQWYQKSPGDTSMKLIGYLYYGNAEYEKSFEEHFNITGDLSGSTAKNGSLFIVNLKAPEHSAVYYCAASSQDTDPAYFGQGTKLTVLETDLTITPPTVKVLPPSKKECKGKDNKRKKTLVCVASKFYPDHVSITWQINGENIITGVATDNAALRLPDRYYKITSRLRVSAKEWFTPGKEFTCIVSFFNGTYNEYHSNSTFGVEAEDAGSSMTRENYLKITQMGKLSYGVFIAKSSLYGAFVLFLVWKLQSSSGKRIK